MTFRNIFLVAAALSLTGLSGVTAQTIVLEPDEEVVVREYVVTQPRTQVVLPEDYDVVIGEPLPETVVVAPLDAPGFTKKYEYVVVGNETVIIEPGTRRVVQVLR